MQLKQYKELIEREQKLQQDMKGFILTALKANGGRITYVSPDADDGDDEPALDDKYPVISTLYGKHNTYNIAVTDVYLVEYGHGHIGIYADGIDRDTETLKKEFPVYPEQFPDIIHFITAPLRERIHFYAARLALKDLVDKYNKLPHEFYSEPGGIKSGYHCESQDNIQKHTARLENLYTGCPEPDSNKQEINSGLMKIIHELADLALIERNRLLMGAMTEGGDGDVWLTSEKQDEFNNLYDETERQIRELINIEGIN
jgi:hypothetical protein